MAGTRDGGGLLADRRGRRRLQLRRCHLLGISRSARHRQCRGRRGGQRLVTCAAREPGPGSSCGGSSWVPSQRYSHPSGPGALVPLKMAIASADSVGNDVYVAVVVDFGNGSGMSDRVEVCACGVQSPGTPMRWLQQSGRPTWPTPARACCAPLTTIPPTECRTAVRASATAAGRTTIWSYWHGSSGAWSYANNGPTQGSRSPARLTTSKG